MENDTERENFESKLKIFLKEINERNIQFRSEKKDIESSLIAMKAWQEKFDEKETQRQREEKDFESRLIEKKIWLEEHKSTYADLLPFAALLLLEEEINDIEIQDLKDLIDTQELIINTTNFCIKEQKRMIDSLSQLDNMEKICRNAIKNLEDGMAKYQITKQGREGAEALHSRPGGSREKQQNIRKIWASGKYTSRDICAEQECAALNMSFSTARKALRKTPEPT